MDANARKALNLRVLQRHDEYILNIIDSASFAVLYSFSRETKEWTKKGVEGTLFLIERVITPTCGFFILNRVGLDNFVAYLTRSMDIIVTPEFVIYQTDKGEVYGLWTYEASDRERIGKRLIDLKGEAIAKEEAALAQSRNQLLNMLKGGEGHMPPVISPPSRVPSTHPSQEPLTGGTLLNILNSANSGYYGSHTPPPSQPPRSMQEMENSQNSLLSLLNDDPHSRQSFSATQMHPQHPQHHQQHQYQPLQHHRHHSPAPPSVASFSTEQQHTGILLPGEEMAMVQVFSRFPPGLDSHYFTEQLFRSINEDPRLRDVLYGFYLRLKQRQGEHH